MTAVDEVSDTEEYFHKTAWRVVKRQIENAEANQTGALYDDLVAMVFAIHTFEGYLNYVGDKILPDLWGKEKTVFAGTGFTKKLAVICEACGIEVPDAGKSPVSTINELKRLRDKMVDPKIQRESKTARYKSSDHVPTFPPTSLDKLITHEKAVRARNDVKALTDQIHEAALKKFPHAGLGHSALEGSSMFRTASISAVK